MDGKTQENVIPSCQVGTVSRFCALSNWDKLPFYYCVEGFRNGYNVNYFYLRFVRTGWRHLAKWSSLLKPSIKSCTSLHLKKVFINWTSKISFKNQCSNVYRHRCFLENRFAVFGRKTQQLKPPARPDPSTEPRLSPTGKMKSCWATRITGSRALPALQIFAMSF